jgi:hypothetical protein
MAVATQADIVVTLAAREDIMKVIPAISISGTTDSGHFMNQRRCPSIDKTLADCPELGEKQWQEAPAEKAGNRFESSFE